MIQRILLVMVILFPLSEIALAFVKRSDTRSAQREDRGSLRSLWFGITVGVVLATGAQWVPSCRLVASPTLLGSIALTLLVAGLTLRWAAIITLGSLFTVDVAIYPEHHVVQRGPYRFMRHPSYTGLFIAFLGLGVFFANWLSIAGLLIPLTIGILNRVTKEEQALLHELGPAYAEYCSRTKRFIPGWL